LRLPARLKPANTLLCFFDERRKKHRGRARLPRRAVTPCSTQSVCAALGVTLWPSSLSALEQLVLFWYANRVAGGAG
jgi:hypothetical protein